MYHRDYTIRLLQQFVMFMAHLAGLLKKNDPEMIAMELESAFHMFTGFPRNIVMRMEAGALLQMFGITGELDADRTMMTALLLKEEAALALRLGSPDEAAVLEARAGVLTEAARKGVLSAELRELIDGE